MVEIIMQDVHFHTSCVSQFDELAAHFHTFDSFLSNGADFPIFYIGCSTPASGTISLFVLIDIMRQFCIGNIVIS